MCVQHTTDGNEGFVRTARGTLTDRAAAPSPLNNNLAVYRIVLRLAKLPATVYSDRVKQTDAQCLSAKNIRFSAVLMKQPLVNFILPSFRQYKRL